MMLGRMFSRRTILSRLGLLGAGTFGASLVGANYATAVEPHQVALTRYSLTPRGWPPGKRLRVAILTDFHAHPRNMGEGEIEQVVARTNALRPDVTVLLGDYCSQAPGPVSPEAVARILSGLRAARGVYAIQGNHDWTDDRATFRRGVGPTRVERALHDSGIALIENDRALLDEAAKLWLVGLESEIVPATKRAARWDDDRLDQIRVEKLNAVLRPLPADATVVLLAHEPDLFAKPLDGRVAVTLSGHTHGGQVRILGWSPYVPSRYGNRYAYGHVVENDRHLIVSAGLGAHFVAGRPVRIGIPPEIVLVELGTPEQPRAI
jgi:uncharacterized protein